MNTIDIVLGIILLVAFYLGFKRGFILVLTSLLAVIAGAFCAIYFSGYAQARLYDWFDWNGDTTRLVGFALTFIAVVLVVSLLGRLVTKLLNFAFLGGINKLLGGFVNVLKYAFIVSLIFMFINATNNLRILT
ncbi:MAG: CvpA family protein, partial [Marinirhabdus sp.]